MLAKISGLRAAPVRRLSRESSRSSLRLSNSRGSTSHSSGNGVSQSKTKHARFLKETKRLRSRGSSKLELPQTPVTWYKSYFSQSLIVATAEAR